VQIQTRKRLSETIDPKSGEKVSLISEEEYTKTPSAGEVVSAANVLNKMDGTYQTQEAMGSLLSLELKTAFKKSIRPAAMQAVLDGETVDSPDLTAEKPGKLPSKDSLTAKSLEKHGLMTENLPLNDSNRGDEDSTDRTADSIATDTVEISTKSRDSVDSITVESIPDSIQADTLQVRDQGTGEGGAGSSRGIKMVPSPTALNFSNLEDEIEEEIYLEMLNEGL
jgi:hypothetical protein